MNCSGTSATGRPDGELLPEWRIEGCEVHGLTRSADGRIWIGDASTNAILVVEP